MEKKNQDFLPWLKSLLFEQSKDKKSKYHYMLVVLALGVGFMLFGNLFFGGDPKSNTDRVISADSQQDADEPAFSHKDNGSSVSATISDYETRFENQLKEALESIAGVQDVSVVVNVDASEKTIYEKNITTHNQKTEEVDKSGGKRNTEDGSRDEQLVTIREDNKERPLVQEVKKPVIRGVLVTAQGAESIHVKQMILDAVTRVLDVPQHKVAVLPKKSKGD